MDIIKIIKDEDIGSDTPAPSKYIERKAGRAIVFDNDNMVALLHSTKSDYYNLPGGGVEEGEDIMTALRREVLEEIGCEIKNIRDLGIIEEYRNEFSLHQISYCYTADVAGEKGSPNLTESEIADGFETVWVSLEEAIRLTEVSGDTSYYEGRFMRMRNLIFLKGAARINKRKTESIKV